MKIANFSLRNFKELYRDPITAIFAVILPVFLLVIMSAINSKFPVDIFSIDRLSPGIIFFGLSFLSLFASITVSYDFETAFLLRLFSTPMKVTEFLLGYILPLTAVGAIQTVICLVFSAFFGLKVTFSWLSAMIVSILCSLLFSCLGVCLGCVLSNKASGGISSVIVQLTAWFGGIWFDISVVGGLYEKISFVLPFYHGVEAIKQSLCTNYLQSMLHLLVILLYAALFFFTGMFLFKKKMK